MHYCCDNNIETYQSPEFNMMETTGDDFLLINQDLCYDSNMESNEISHADDHHIIIGHHEIKLHIRAAHDQMMIPVNNDNNDQSQSSGGGKVSNPSLGIYMKRLRDPIDDINDQKDKSGPLQRKKNQKVASSSEEEDVINTIPKRQNTMISCSSTDKDDSIAPSRCSSKRGKSRLCN
ncbi:hypothetical protein LIER_15255 [Lithospermum erythrorhizon]|uniref:Uncharacterized protein n=1 Tax=Lithospermum erythrorhizon TaxID=34254 RepID=A0AAV3Q435_LITER